MANALEVSSYIKNIVNSITWSWSDHGGVVSLKVRLEEDDLAWLSPPSTRKLKLNCDHDVATLGTAAAIGGCLRDELGRLICGFASNIGSCSVVTNHL